MVQQEHVPDALASSLTKAQKRALRHVAEQTSHIEAHNIRWPLDRQVPGAWGATAELRGPTVSKLHDLGLVEIVERWPASRHAHKYALTERGRAAVAAIIIAEGSS